MPQPFAHAAAPHEAENTFQEFCRAYKKKYRRTFSLVSADPGFLKIFGNSRFLTLRLCRHPEWYGDYKNNPYKDKEKPLGVFLGETARITADKKNPILALTRYKYREYLRLTLKELRLLDQGMIYRELAHLACAVVRFAVTFTHAKLCKKFALKASQGGDYCLLAMGKLGGLELNYSSDIDLIGLYERDRTRGKITTHEFYCRMFADLGGALSGCGPEGFLYRVDWDLRPEGKAGTLANSFGALENYYETFGAEWERQAYLKAGVLYQRRSLGDRFLELMIPFSFRKSLDEKTFHEIRKLRSRRLAEMKTSENQGFNVKLHAGGIRDVEFAVQALQLLFGGRHQILRVRDTLGALAALATLKILSEGDCHTLAAAYRFFRRIESALQMEDERQTHWLPFKSLDLCKVARRLGSVEDDAIAGDALAGKIDITRSAVREVCGRVHEV